MTHQKTPPFLMVFRFAGWLFASHACFGEDLPVNYRVLMHRDTVSKAKLYLTDLASGANAGAFLKTGLKNANLTEMPVEEFIERLMRTKKPQIFAESAVAGDGTDWNQRELEILGDISIGVPVTIFDNGRHRDPEIHAEPLAGHLLFTPGALLRHGRGGTPADWAVTGTDGKIDFTQFCGLYERRLLPVFAWADEVAAANGRKAFITIPGLGCGQFAGRFQGTLGLLLGQALRALLEKHGRAFPHLAAVYYDPYDEGENTRSEIHGIYFLVRPLMKGNAGKPQLCRPTAYAENPGEFAGCDLFSVVAWDHVSWPGNDFYGGSRATDDGVKAAATSSMEAMTGIRGFYDASRHQYQPPQPFSRWQELVETNQLQLSIKGAIAVFPRKE
jgi:hypothetical protein